jgi:hypothetical protein
MKRRERDGRIGRRPLLPAAREAAAPLARQGPDGRRLGLALVALRLGVHRGPAGRPARLGRPCDTRWPEARGPLEAPGPPGLLAAPFRPRCAPGLVWEGGGGGRACAVCAAGDEPPGDAAGARAGAGLAEGDRGMARRARCAGGVESGESRQGSTELGAAGRPQERMGRAAPVIGGKGGRR